MKFLYFLLIVAFVFGQVFSLDFCCSVRISFLDIAVLFLLCGFYLRTHFIKAFDSYLKTFGPFLLAAFISLFFAGMKLSLDKIGISSLYLLRFIAYSSLVMVVTTHKLKEVSLTWLWWGGVSVAVLGLMQYFLYPNLRNLSYLGWDPHQFRLFSTTLDPNFTGIILVLTLILGDYLYREKERQRLLIGSFMLVVVIALFLTYSRGSFVAFLGAVSVWTWVKRKFKTFLLLLIIFAGALVILPKPAGEGVQLLRVISISARLENNQEAWDIFKTSPLIGVGFDTLRYVRKSYLVTGTSEISHSGAGFHNSWLFILATTGIIGGMTFIWMWHQIFQRSFQAFKKRIDAPKYHLLLISVIAVFVHSLFDNSLFYPEVMVWLWIMVGMSFSFPT